jgi:saccharopine dehydrogenase-like NADP-dependent oxidoreductase
MMKFRGIDQEVYMVDHEHDEPVTMGLLADKVFKGVKNVEFKYGGPHVVLSESLYNMGLLSNSPVTLNGAEVIPKDLVLKLCPPAPKFQDEIKTILDQGLVTEEGAFLVRVDGHKEDKPIRIDCYVNSPALVEAFEKSGLSHEAYLTGQCAAVFVEMMVDDAFAEKGLFVPEQLDSDARRYCFHKLAGLDITVDEIIKKRIA